VVLRQVYESDPVSDVRAGHDADLGYHQRMVADPHRMVAYERALRRVVRPGDVVLDVGAGTGVLSLWAARLGARVHAVESMAVADVIMPLAVHHGVSERIQVHRADMRTLPISEPVDVIVSECLGRFLVDDGMLEAMQAARRWLKPTGRVIPAEVELWLAPIELLDFAPLDTWTMPILGLDLAPLAPLAEHQTYGVALQPTKLLAAPLRCGRWSPSEAAPALYPATFSCARGGRLRGLAGWFRARLADDVWLTNAPGYDTHWQQHLFPLPAQEVTAGEVLKAHVDWRLGPEGYPSWTWSVARRSTAVARANGGAAPEVHERVTMTADEARAEAEAALARGDLRGAARAFAAEAEALPEGDPDVSPTWENVGITLHAGGFYAAALAPLMRALDGGLEREQALRLLVDCAFHAGHTNDGERWLGDYERTFGPHPSGWTRPA